MGKMTANPYVSIFLQREVFRQAEIHHHHPDFTFILFYAYLYGHYPGSVWMIVIIANQPFRLRQEKALAGNLVSKPLL